MVRDGRDPVFGRIGKRCRGVSDNQKPSIQYREQLLINTHINRRREMHINRQLNRQETSNLVYIQTERYTVRHTHVTTYAFDVAHAGLYRQAGV